LTINKDNDKVVSHNNRNIVNNTNNISSQQHNIFPPNINASNLINNINPL